MRAFPLLISGFLLLSPLAADAAGCVHSLGVGAGVVIRDHSKETDFSLGADYECRKGPFFGWGAFANAIFSDPSTTVLGAPVLYFHPLRGDFYVAGSPILELGGGRSDWGMRLSTRLPIPLGLLTLVPSAAVDFIRGGRRWWLGLGLRI